VRRTFYGQPEAKFANRNIVIHPKVRHPHAQERAESAGDGAPNDKMTMCVLTAWPDASGLLIAAARVHADPRDGLGEMNPNQLKETTMDPATRSMLKVTLPGPHQDRQPVKDLVERLMGRDPVPRFEIIQNSAAAVDEDAIDA
jgi:DNA gyrase/topoisomerase IV subunit B